MSDTYATNAGKSAQAPAQARYSYDLVYRSHWAPPSFAILDWRCGVEIATTGSRDAAERIVAALNAVDPRRK